MVSIHYVIRPEARILVLSVLAKFVCFSHHKLNVRNPMHYSNFINTL